MCRLLKCLGIAVLMCLWWLGVRLATVAAFAVWTVAFYLTVFALCVRGHTLVSDEKPHLSSFDPRRRVAAVEAASREYGVQP